MIIVRVFVVGVVVIVGVVGVAVVIFAVSVCVDYWSTMRHFVCA